MGRPTDHHLGYLDQPTLPVKSAHQSVVLMIVEEQRLEEEGKEDPEKRGRKGKGEMEDKERLATGSQSNLKLLLLCENRSPRPQPPHSLGDL